MSMLVVSGRSLGYTSAEWRRDRVCPFEGNTDVC